jgi:hypothetical protein
LPERDELEEEGLAMGPTSRPETPILKTGFLTSEDNPPSRDNCCNFL